ncbi:MAG: Asp-tRNA(Asn)/Glu-tRNA(Gln) amidotransferase subunit GatB [Candidatus Jordarchaeales archaeon]|nr:Asp-tRNA(Asn)/Glu-tRNA(Gln) amidotransferase subunit GatB [Candidatus Jordarchaeia archaeon]
MPIERSEELGVKIGLEVHVQLTALKTKLFCSCSANYRGMPPNTLTCPICLGHPGTLPVLNRKAVEHAMMVALALNSSISPQMFFFRKNYFYVDLPKNFQISQYDKAGGAPLSTGGWVEFSVNGERKKVRIRRIQLEEDPARLTYPGTITSAPYTLVDFNRAGVALLEIVTEPDMETPEEAYFFLQKLRSILEHLGVSSENMQGSMRCDANISIMGGARVEIKNISSFRDVRRALQYEIMRQKQLLRRGGVTKQETRHWDEDRQITVSLRVKETESDYRYFPEPDLVPVKIPEEWVSKVASQMPELPDARKERFISDYGIPEYDAIVLTSSKKIADFFEECCKLYSNPKKIANWIMSDLLRNINETGMDVTEMSITAEQFIEMIKMIDEGLISGKIAKRVLRESIRTGRPPRIVVEDEGLLKISDENVISKLADEVFREFPKAVEDARRDRKAVNFLVGQVMKKTRGRADPDVTNKVILSKLEENRAIPSRS